MTAATEVIDGPEKYYAAAVTVAAPYARRGTAPLDDLVQICVTAIAEHWHEWNPARSNRLTWAMRWCRWSIWRAMRRGETNRLVLVPKRAIAAGHVHAKVYSIHVVDRRDHPEYDRAHPEYDRATAVYDAAVEEPPPVAPLLAVLSARSRDVIGRRFGLGGRPRQTLHAIGRDLGLTRERVRQIELAALRQMRLEALRKGVSL